ncbi:MAG: pentapeptide repeat-containing protein, partial [Plesiomonas sp.]
MQLKNINFNGVFLCYANFHQTSLNDVSFCGSVLDNAVFDLAKLENVNLDGASLIDTSLMGSQLNDVSFKMTSIDNAKFIGSNFSFTDFLNENIRLHLNIKANNIKNKKSFSKSQGGDIVNFKVSKISVDHCEEMTPEYIILHENRILYGVRRYLSSKFSLFTDKYRNEIESKQLSIDFLQHIHRLLLKLTRNGDVMVITFSNAEHSSIVLRHDDNNYLLSRTSRRYITAVNEKCYERLAKEMLFYNDNLCSEGSDIENFFLISNMDTKIMLDSWGKSGRFNFLFNNCSSAARDVLLAGSKLNNRCRKRLKNNRVLQMPANTGRLAKEIAALKISDF